MRVLAGEAVGELVHVGEADEDRPRILQPGHRRRVARGGRGVGADRRARAGRPPGDVEQILGRERAPRERPVPDRLAGLCHRLVAEDVGEGVEPRILAPDPFQRPGDGALGRARQGL